MARNKSKVATIVSALKRAREVTITLPRMRCAPVRLRNASYPRTRARELTRGVKRIEDAFFAVVPKSASPKTKGVATTYSTSASCPDACSFKGQGCYAEGGQVGIHWQGIDSGGKVGGHIKGIGWKDMLAALRAIPEGRRLRFNVSGDLPGLNNRISRGALLKMVKAAGGTSRQQFTYTHKPVLDPDVWGKATTSGNLAALRAARRRGLVVNLSADTLADADRKAKLGFPVVLTLPSEAATRAGAAKYARTPEGRRVVVCPAVAAARAETFAGRTSGKRRTKTAAASAYLSCSQCGGKDGVALCARGDRDYIVGFPAHGQDEKRAEAVFMGAAPTATELEAMRKKLPRGLTVLRNPRGRKGGKVWRRFRTSKARPVLAVVMPNSTATRQSAARARAARLARIAALTAPRTGLSHWRRR